MRLIFADLIPIHKPRMVIKW